MDKFHVIRQGYAFVCYKQSHTISHRYALPEQGQGHKFHDIKQGYAFVLCFSSRRRGSHLEENVSEVDCLVIKLECSQRTRRKRNEGAARRKGGQRSRAQMKGGAAEFGPEKSSSLRRWKQPPQDVGFSLTSED
ncbi:hypothetical protein CEXT_426011 [Caerostris extrusa]|uniref:Uncharacterized protein n=1 Tax=Caerostris extrusa TaxID=172846 RepID=A0AAV4P2L0_CAEEX|nr:hypothetical protein CEXT_426011 [Caerostris extrusa]